MSGSSGISKSIYFTREEADWLAIEASEYGISFKDLVKAKCNASNDKVKVVRQFSLGREGNLSLFNIAETFFRLSLFFDDPANDDGSPDYASIRNRHDEVMNELSEAIATLRSAVKGS